MSNLPRFHCPTALQTGDVLNLPAGTARHVQVLRLQPEDEICLFNGEGGEFRALIQHMGRSDVSVRVGDKRNIERELSVRVNLWASMMANERMDWLVEKATELGASNLVPITAERSILKLKGERADKKLAHWQAIAVAASEQCGRNRVLQMATPLNLSQAIASLMPAPLQRPLWILSLSPGAISLQKAMEKLHQAPLASDPQAQTRLEVILLSGPEGGLSPAEEALALASGFQPVTLGPRVLRAETAPIAVLSALNCWD
jgi:16S rRNA (uracil1498-N3)-methyltransferase